MGGFRVPETDFLDIFIVPIICLIVLALAVGYAALQNAGVSPPDTYVTLVAIGLAAMLRFVTRPAQSQRLLTRTSAALLAVVYAVACLQVIPLPLPVLEFLSPARAELLRALAPVAAIPSPATLSILPAATVEMLLEMTGRLAVFLLILDLTRQLEARPWISSLPLLLIAAVESSLGVLQVKGGSDFASGSYNSRVHFAGLLEMCLPFAIVYAVATFRRRSFRGQSSARRFLSAGGLLVAGGVSYIGIVESHSRMAFLATTVALLVIAVLFAGARLGGWKRLAAGGALLAMAILALIFLPSDAVVGHFGELAEGMSANTRTHIWRETGGIIRDFPLFGCGLGGYVSCFQRYKVVAPMSTVDYAHNDFLQYWAELGTIGFVAGLIFFGRLFFKSLAAAAVRHDRDRRYRALACVGSLTALGLHSFVDFNMYVPANGLVLAWIAGIAAADGSEYFPGRRRRHSSRPEACSERAGEQCDVSGDPTPDFGY